MPPAIRVENLGKQYLLGELERYSTFRETIARAVTRPASRLFHRLHRYAISAPGQPSTTNHQPSTTSHSPESIWALRDVSFEVKHGEVLGIIGPNGAGKSTLLKILSRITEPTTGYAEIRGRVGSLLEVGTGFHPELTGRENVYLNGSILGMSKAEIRRKFDDIVSFAGVEKFIDTPVKRYSSGMQVRLAFAVAAHLDPEILIVDEVLAVGDAEFQKRCLGKMDEVSRSGRTILFVSHNMAAVERLCNRVIVLRRGHTLFEGDTSAAVNAYLAESAPITARFSPHHGEGANPLFSLVSIAIYDSEGQQTTAIESGRPIQIRIRYGAKSRASHPEFAIGLYNNLGVKVAHLASRWQQLLTTVNNPKAPTSTKGTGVVDCNIASLPLAPGTYYLNVYMGFGGQQLVHIPGALAFHVTEPRDPEYSWVPGARKSLVVLRHTWQYK